MFLVIRKGDSNTFIMFNLSSVIGLGIWQLSWYRKALSRTTFLANLSISLSAYLTFFNSSYSVCKLPLSKIVHPKAGLQPSKNIKFLSLDIIALLLIILLLLFVSWLH